MKNWKKYRCKRRTPNSVITKTVEIQNNIPDTRILWDKVDE